MWLRALGVVGVTLALASQGAHVAAQTRGYGTQNGEWQTYGGDLRSTRYSPLDQITAANFDTLDVAWRFKTDALGPRAEFNFQATPLMVDGVLYMTGGTRRAAVALDASNGEMLWMHSVNEGKRAAISPRQLSGRGLAYWTDGSARRIVYVTPGYQMVALDARTGETVKSFGRNGMVDLTLENDQPLDPESGEIGLQATPLIVNDVIIVGAAHAAVPKNKTTAKGYIRGYDARTGKRLWIFHTVPRSGEFGNDTWEGDSWSYTGNAGVWAQMSADPDLGLVYLPVELPAGDFYGGNRPGAGLFGESIVALDVKTGRRRWHFQTVHHGIWDMDLPCAPILADLVVNGRAIKALAQPTKQAWLYVLNRETGEPVWPIEERAVERGTVAGEWYAPTQPFVTKPPAYDRQGVSEDDLIDFTPELRAEALRFVSRYKLGPIFTPPVVSTWPGPLGTLVMPSATGGSNWQGGALDPASNMLYVFSNTAPTSLGLLPLEASKSDFGYAIGTARDPQAAPGSPAGDNFGPMLVQGLPIIKPPYGRITALDLNNGTMAWQIAHGETPDNIKSNPALKGLTIPRTGRQGRIGVLVTKSLVIAGEGGFATTPGGRRGALLRAYDKATGKDAGAVYMPAPQSGSPMTYMLNGKQYIAVAVSGAGYSGELIAYALGS